MNVINQNQENNTQEPVKYKSWIYPKKIPEKVCDLLITDFQNSQFEYGTVGKIGNFNKNARYVKTVPVPVDHWSLGILLYFGMDANLENFRYNVSHLELTDFLTYEEGMFYHPHNDVSDRINNPTHYRKLTVILQLSDENDYNGGDIILYNSNLKPQKMTRERGSIIVFDSSITHSVSKVKSGTRHSLCGWIVGPSFS